MKHYLFLLVKFLNVSKNTGITNAVRKAVNYLKKRRNQLQDFSGTVNSKVLLSFEHNPLISILVVSFNSRVELKNLFNSLQRQSYKNFEVVLIENGDQDNSELLYSFFNKSKYISTDNIGFSAANNLAFEHSSGSYVFLANPDIILTDDALTILIDQFRFDSNIAVAVPKIYFSYKFIDIEISSDEQFSLQIDDLIANLRYKKYFLRHGFLKNSIIYSSENRVLISLPLDESRLDIRISSTNDEAQWKTVIRDKGKPFSSTKTVFLCTETFTLNLSKSEFEGRWIINNAGSYFVNGMPADRGFGEYDFFNHYSSPEYVDALCGAAALIDPKILFRRKIFVDQFFAYYEDSELSSYIGRMGYKIKYTPSSIVTHDHSTATTEGSTVWSTLVNRGRHIYQYLCLNYELRITSYYSLVDVNPNLATKLDLLDSMLLNIDKDDLVKQDRKVVGIYNSYWNTYGGGERHALSIASWFSKWYDIVLISEEDFDEEALLDHFGLSFKLRKLVCPAVDTALTSMFDIFINSTFSSSLISHACVSLYIVSFPHRNVSEEFLSNYLFLHNSDYTSDWAYKYWGSHKSYVLYPVLLLTKLSNLFTEKENFLITIGRFSPIGHAKRHDVIIKAFIKAKRNLDSNYKLFVCGSYNQDNIAEKNYFSYLSELCANNKDIFLRPNMKFDELQSLLSQSKAYLHATGFGVNEDLHPEKMEHFGITVIEAALYNSFPIVFFVGGPARSVECMNWGLTFETLEDLEKILSNILEDKLNFSSTDNAASYFQAHNKNVLDEINDLLKQSKKIL